MSASLVSSLSRTWPAGALAAAGGGFAATAGGLTAPVGARRSGCTWRKVTGKVASASRSITPKGAAANLAIGGAAPVATFSGKLAALASGRPASSFNSRGMTTL